VISGAIDIYPLKNGNVLQKTEKEQLPTKVFSADPQEPNASLVVPI